MYHVILDPLLHFQESNGLSRPGNKVYNGRKKKSQPSFQIVPEWYFLCQYAMLKAVPDEYNSILIRTEINVPEIPKMNADNK